MHSFAVQGPDFNFHHPNTSIKIIDTFKLKKGEAKLAATRAVAPPPSSPSCKADCCDNLIILTRKHRVIMTPSRYNLSADPALGCVDIDECLNESACEVGKYCFNKPGSVACLPCATACDASQGCTDGTPEGCNACRDG